MAYTLHVKTSHDTGAVSAWIEYEEGSVGGSVLVPVHGDLLSRYEQQVAATAARNPDMTPAQIGDVVLERWYRQLEAEAEAQNPEEDR